MAFGAMLAACGGSGSGVAANQNVQGIPILNPSQQDSRCRDPVMLYEDHPFGFRDGRGAINSAELATIIGATYLRNAYRDDGGGPSRPLRAILRNGVWHVRETLPEGWAGGGLRIDMCQSNGRILMMWGDQ